MVDVVRLIKFMILIGGRKQVIFLECPVNVRIAALQQTRLGAHPARSLAQPHLASGENLRDCVDIVRVSLNVEHPMGFRLKPF